MSDEDEKVIPFWRETVTNPKPPTATVQEAKQPYLAIETQDKCLGFVLYCHSTGVQHVFFYSHLLSINAHDPKCDFILLTTSTSLIRIYGQRLQPILNALYLHTCKSIREFSKELYFPAPEGDGQPFIERIAVTLVKGEEIPQRRPKTPEDEG